MVDGGRCMELVIGRLCRGPGAGWLRGGVGILGETLGGRGVLRMLRLQAREGCGAGYA